MLLADAIETCGGFNRLARLFNRFGACASPDTHARYVQYRVEKAKKKGQYVDTLMMFSWLHHLIILTSSIATPECIAVINKVVDMAQLFN